MRRCHWSSPIASSPGFTPASSWLLRCHVQCHHCRSRFHDYIVWCIDLAGQNGSLDDLYIHDNLFQDYDWAYSPTYWTGYNYHPESCSNCFVGSPHQDAIFHRTGTAGSINGANIDIYNNTWTGTHTNGVATSCIYLEYAASANIYNNLFNIPMPASRRRRRSGTRRGDFL